MIFENMEGIQRQLNLALILMVANCGYLQGSLIPPHGNIFEVPPFIHGYHYQFPISYHPYHQHQHHHRLQSKPNAIPAVVPVSPVFDVEVMKPMAQLDEKKLVLLYIVPQNSLHVFPHAQQQKTSAKFRLPPIFAKYQSSLPLLSPGFTASPGHIPAVEVPLEKPMVIGSAEAQVLAPAGFTVLLNGPYGSPVTYPIETFALLAPVPVGTIISPATPVVLTTIYAVPTLPSLPTSIKILAEFFKPGQSQGPHPESPPSDDFFVPINIHHELPTSTEIAPDSPENLGVTTSTDGQTELISYPSAVPTVPSQSLREPQTPISPIPSDYDPNQFHIHNSKEAPYLTQLREESLKRQIFSLQKQLEKLQSSRV